MKKRIILFATLLAAIGFILPEARAEKIRVVVTMGTLADFAGQIMGPDAEIHVVAKPGRDIHFIQPTPKDVLKVKKADVLIHGGLDLEAWRQPLLNAAGNARFLGESKSAIDVSQGIPLLEVPESLSRIGGDIHAFGNPHYWTDPENAKWMVQNIADGLARIYPQSAESYQANAQSLIKAIAQAEIRWDQALSPYQGAAIVTYHKSWPYFAKRFGFEVIGFIEPKPGIPPTAKHLRELVSLMREKNARLVVKETYNESRAAEKIAREAGVPLITLLQFAGEEKTSSYVAMMTTNVERIVKSLKE